MAVQQKSFKTMSQTEKDGIISSIAGTFAIEGIKLSPSSKDNMERIMSGKATYEQVLNEIKAKYGKAE